MEEFKLHHTKAIVTISTIEGYKPEEENVNDLDFDTFCRELQNIEENEFAKSSISWLVYPARTIYKSAWGSPRGGEPVFVLEADYTEYDKGTDIHDWKRNVFIHADYLRDKFKQETVRVTFVNDVETTILR